MDERFKCKNNGLCLPRAAALNNYVCSCKSPYCGRTCSNRIPNCIEEGLLS